MATVSDAGDGRPEGGSAARRRFGRGTARPRPHADDTASSVPGTTAETTHGIAGEPQPMPAIAGGGPPGGTTLVGTADGGPADRGPAGTVREGGRRWLTPTGLVVIAALLHAVLALVAVGIDRQVRWDEVTYLAQVTPGQPDVWFGPQRARGMTLVLLPVGLLGGSTALLRLWLIGVHATALLVAFRPWARHAGWVGGAAALVAAVGWVPLYFSVEGYPNLLAGLASVAAAGHLLAWVCRRRRADLAAMALAVAVVAWLRPTESVWLAAGLGLAALLLSRWPNPGGWYATVSPSGTTARTSGVLWVTDRERRYRRRATAGSRLAPAATGWGGVAHVAVALAVGGFVGWLPWLVEAVVRFGGPLERLAAARDTSASGAARNSLVQYLSMVEGPVRQVTAEPVLTMRALALLVGLGLLAIVGVLARRRTTQRVAATTASVASVTMLLPYLVLNAGVNLRYLLPALLLATIPIGAGLVVVASIVHRQRARPAGVVLIALVVATVGWQAQLARVNSDDIAPLQARPVPLGEALAAAAGGDDCAFLSNVQWPEIQWHSGCLGEVLDPDAPLLQCHDARRDLAALAEDGHRVFVLHRGQPPALEPLTGWDVVQLPEPENGVWWLYERPADHGLGDPPTIPRPEDSTTPCPPSRAPDTTDARLRIRW